MDSWDSVPSFSFELDSDSNNQGLNQESSSAWLEFVDWPLSNSGTWVEGTQHSTSTEGVTLEVVDFQGFEDQNVEVDITNESFQCQSVPGEGQPDTDESILEQTWPGHLDTPDAPLTNQIKEERNRQELQSRFWRTIETLRNLEDEGPAPRPSPSPRRNGRLSNFVRRGMEELKHAKGACWRCKILRKRVSTNSV